jgi:hypothetical protein
MDNVILGILVAVLVVIGLLLFFNRRPASEAAPGTSGQRRFAGAHREPSPRLETGNDAEPQTRFVETGKPKQYRLLNNSEQELYHRLCEAMPNMKVFAQVGVAQLALARGRQEAQRLSRMAGRGVDFVVCDADFSIVAAIELAWPTTGQEADNAEDVKRVALQSLGIPMIVFRPNKLPEADTISREIADAILRRNRLEAERS